MNEQLLRSLERIATALENLAPTSSLQLGFGEPPTPQYIFVGQEPGQGLWYSLKDDSKVYLPQKALTGTIKKIEITHREYKSKEQIKLDITIQADKLYVLRTGFGTVFFKGLLLGLNTLDSEKVKRPIIIAVSAGEETVVFCRLYDAITRTPIQAEWDPDVDWLEILQKVQKFFPSTKETTAPPFMEIWRTWKNPADAIAWAQSQLPDMSMEELHSEFESLPAKNGGKKAPAWVERVKTLVDPF